MSNYDDDANARLGANIAKFYDALYQGEGRYWWKEDDPYSGNPDAYPTALVTQMTLRLMEPLHGRGRVLDLGAGEGADAIRLALLGYDVTAVEISGVGAEKTKKFAEQAGVRLQVEVADIAEYQAEGLFDLIICGGVLPYLRDRRRMLESIQGWTRSGGLNFISVWTAFSPTPSGDTEVPIYLDSETGPNAILLPAYESWKKEFLFFDRNKIKNPEPGVPEQSRSYIKMIARKPG